MAEATLRAYLKEIDELIEREQLDEAIAHCRHILQVYPKHLDTYRLLGKAYLEAKRFGDAADIFQRVLSAVPDDFVAHVGMSIVREDEGNTDAAIWHMERAFETTPANPAIQQELRRLIGRRDGIEPHKVRLTRGALARMYAHGELYPQAVAELRAALQEDPERADLQVVLAEMYWRTGQRAEAVEIANKIIEKLPYCREANRILAAGYQSGGRTEEAANHHRRLATLDPYAAFIETPMADPQAVDAGSVRLDRLEWVPGQAMPLGQPEWASSLSADLRTEAKPQPVSGPVPSWLEEPAASEAPEPAAPPPTPVPQPTPAPAPAPAKPPSGGEIPPWIRQAGWSESTGAAVEGPVQFSEEEISGLETGGGPAAEAGELAPGEIPEWLKGAAPKGAVTEEPLPESWGSDLLSAGGAGGQAPPWLEEPEAALGAEPAPEPAWQPPAAEAPVAPVEPEAPEEWVAPTAEAEAPQAAESELEGQPLPSWLEEPSPGATDTIITWLGDRAARDTGEMAMPEWMREGAPVEEPAPAAEEEPAAPSLLTEEPVEEAPAAEEAQPGGALPGWLAGVAGAAAQQEPLQPEELAVLRERGEVAPGGEEEPWAAEPAEAEEAGPAATREAPDWLRGIVEPSAAAEPEQPAEEPSGPSWLAGTEIPRPRTFAPSPEPDWLRGLGEPEPTGPEMPQEVPEAPGWLKSIQQAREPEPSAEPEAPSWMEAPSEAVTGGEQEAPEDWLRSIGEAAAAPEAVEEAPAEEAPALAEAQLPDWLSGMAPPQPPPPAEMPTEAELGGALGWLEEAAEEPSPEVAEMAAPAEEMQPLAAAAEVSGEEDVLEWLEGLAAQQATGEVAAEAEVVEAEEEPLVEERVLPEGPAEGLEWLERLAASRGIEGEEETIPSIGPAAAEAAPDWLTQAAEQPTPSEEAVEGQPEAALDWLGAAEEAAPAAETPIEVREAEPAALEEEPHVPTWLLDSGRIPPPPVEPGLPPIMEEALAPSLEAPAEALPEETEVPDWLRAPAAPPTAPVPEPAVAPLSALEPGWLGPGEEPAPPISEEIEAAVPDWLRAPSEPEPTPAPTAPPAPIEAPSVWEPIAAARARETEIAAPVPAPAAREPEPALPVAAAPPPPVTPPQVVPVTTAEPERFAPPPIAAPAPPRPQPVIAAPAEAPVAAPPPQPRPEPAFMPTPEPAPAAPPRPEPTYVPPAPAAPAPVAAPRPTVGPPPAPALPTPVAPPVQPAPAPAAPPPYAPTPAYPPPLTPAYAPPQPTYPPAQPAYPAPSAAPPPYWPSAPRPSYTPPLQPPPYPAPTYAPQPQPAAAQAAPAAPLPAGKPKAGGPSPEEVLDRARAAMGSGDIDGALYHYASLIKKKRQLSAIIEDLQSAVEGRSMPPAVWQALGDAYMKADRLPEAIESYRHGLEAV